jgi:hypothetical protein
MKSSKLGKENWHINVGSDIQKGKFATSYVQSSNLSQKSKDKDSEDKIQVYLRVRPSLEGEEPFDFVINDKTITIPPQKLVNSSFFCDTKTFTFKDVLGAYSKQSQVYDKVAEPLMNDFLSGKDVLIFCYGNTNAGKTYTVMGTEEEG